MQSSLSVKFYFYFKTFYINKIVQTLNCKQSPSKIFDLASKFVKI